ncbi:MAG: DUF2796 domain-containing protein [Acidobacteria bacterium]|nr:DUF2796 domain-containing protein [Acidobacteriota bacterium]
MTRSVLFGTFAFIAAVQLGAQQRAHKAHEHGHAKLNIAFESTSGMPVGAVELESPADSILGFEHAAKTPADKAKQEKALAVLKARFGEMVVLPAGCKMTPAKVEVHVDGQHAEVHAEFNAKCAGPIAGKSISFGFAKVFPKIEEVEVQLLAGTQQAKLEVEKDKGTLQIAK